MISASFTYDGGHFSHRYALDVGVVRKGDALQVCGKLLFHSSSPCHQPCRSTSLASSVLVTSW